MKTNMNHFSRSFHEPFFLLSKPNQKNDAGKGMSPSTSHLLEELYRAFWNPFYGYLRSKGYSHYDAEDLVGGMFAHLIEYGHFDGNGCPDAQCSACRNPRCYSYLLSVLRNYVSNERDRTHATRRGGNCTFVSWEDVPEGDAMRFQSPCPPTPLDILRAQWVSTVIEQSIFKLRVAVRDSLKLKPELFNDLEGYVLGDKPHGYYATLAAKWGLSAPGLRATVSRLRRRFASILIAALVRDGYQIHSKSRNRTPHGKFRHSSSALTPTQIKSGNESAGLALG